MKIICIGRNYRDHAKELGNEVPDEPVIFMKPKNSLVNSNTPFYFPDFTNELHYECELVLKICKNGKYISENKATDFFNAISVGIDFTARDIQNQLKANGLPWEKAKAFDNSAVVGEFVPTSTVDLNNTIFSLRKNGELVQNGNSADMIFSMRSLISNISNYFSLNIGDLIYTGTPAGVGECSVGDELEGFLGEKSMFKLSIK